MRAAGAGGGCCGSSAGSAAGAAGAGDAAFPACAGAAGAFGAAGFTALLVGVGVAAADELGAVDSHRGQGSSKRSPLPSHTGQSYAGSSGSSDAVDAVGAAGAAELEESGFTSLVLAPGVPSLIKSPLWNFCEDMPS